MREHCLRFSLLLMTIVSVTLALPSLAFAQSDDGDLSPAEQWVLEQVALGKIANLDQPQFPSKEDRVLRADFLIRLLENPDIEMTRYGVRIQNAVFDEPLELAYIEVDNQLWLEDCEFNSGVSLYESRFARDLYFRGSTFHSTVDFTFSEVGGNFIADNARFLAKEQTADFNSMKVDGLLSLQGTEFAGAVDFIAAKIGGNFVADGARFTNKEQKADFNSMEVDSSALLPNVEFAGAVGFIAAKIGGSFVANEARFTHTEQKANFNSMKVEEGVFLTNAEFAGPVDFVYAQIGGTFDATEVHFNNEQQPVSFNSMRVDGNIFMRNAEFAGPINFISAQIGGGLLACGAHFNHLASFNSMRVDSSVFLYEYTDEKECATEFEGPVDFVYAQIGESFIATRVHFSNTEQTANFSSITVGNSVFLLNAEFAGSVDFTYAQIGSTFEANNAHFNNEARPATFNSMKVESNVFLQGAEFAGPVNFGFVEVQNNFEANNTKFRSALNEPSFRNMIVGGEAVFVGNVFKNGADFDNAVFLDLTLRGVAPNQSISNLRLSQAVVERKLDLELLEIQNLFARSLRVYGRTNITSVDFLNSADFENSQFGDLQVDKVNWPEGLRNIKLGGMSYQNIRMILEGDEEANEESLDELIDLVDRSAYNAQAYATLENYFVQQGYADMADEVYIRYKLREFKERLNPSSMGWWSNRLLWFVGYGRKPGFVLIGALLFILIGWLGFFRKPEDMVSLSQREIVRPNVGHRGTLSRKVSKRVIFSPYEGPYSPFWYSLDLFIPFVDLGYDNKWAPRPSRKWARIYSKLHMLAGWVLIPIGLLAITGVIK